MNSNTPAPILSEDVINQIKDLPKYYKLTGEQKSLIDELIPNEELRERYKYYELCEECSQPNTGHNNHYNHGWCQSCNSKHFQQDFNKWTSGNKEIDEFIQKFQLNATCCEEVLEWIPYKKFEDIEYLAKGGFGTVYKAKWIDGDIKYWNANQTKWYRIEYDKRFVLKCLNNSQNLTSDFLQEITLHKKFIESHIINCFGISQDPKTKNFMMVMQYIKNGSMSQFLKSNYNKLSLVKKLGLFLIIAQGLRDIHNKGLIRLHSGNILSYDERLCFITDLGLCKPVDEQDEKKIHGVLPYIAPEVLRGKIYTKSADIYSFGILAYEILSGLPPYHNLPHYEFLAIKICQGLRPKFNNPLLLINLIDQCLDADPLKRPTTDRLVSIIHDWFMKIDKQDTEFSKQCKEVEESNQSITLKLNTSSSPSYTTHPQAIYTSRLLDYKNLPKPQNSKEINDQFYNSSDSLECLQINSQKIKAFNLIKEINDDKLNKNK